MSEGLKAGVDYYGIAVNFVCHDGDEFLMHQKGEKARDGEGSWEFGAGQLDLGETLEEGVLRELYEEHGARGRIEAQWPAYSLLRDRKGEIVTDRQMQEVHSSWLIVPFLIAVSRQDVDETREPEKIAKRGWFRLDALPTPLHPGAVATLNHCKKQFDVFRKV